MEVCGGPRPEWEASRSLLGASRREADDKRESGHVAPTLTGSDNSAQMETITERLQSWSQRDGISNEGSAEVCLHTAFPRQQFRRQQAVCGGVEAARATGAKTLTSSRTSSNLAVRRCMDDFLDLTWHSSRLKTSEARIR